MLIILFDDFQQLDLRKYRKHRNRHFGKTLVLRDKRISTLFIKTDEKNNK